MSSLPQAQDDTQDVVICYRCQMRVPPRLVTFEVGPRAGVEGICAACRPMFPGGEAKRAEVVAMRRAMWETK